VRDVIDSDFLAAQLASPRLKRQAIRAARGVAQPTVNLAEIKKFKVIVPSLKTQQAFSARTRTIRMRQATSEQALTADAELLSVLQSRAFRGGL
jgi:type I restriction enzyme S subunit